MTNAITRTNNHMIKKVRTRRENSFLFPSFSFLSFPFSLPVRCTMGRCLTLTFARVLVFEHLSTGPGLPSQRQGPHQVCCPCSRAQLGCLNTECVSSPRDWAVSVGSHMQQKMGISEALPRLGAPIPLIEYRSRHTSIQKFDDSFP